MKTYFFIWQHFQNTSYMSMLNFHCRGGVYKIQTNKNSIKLKILHFERNKKFFLKIFYHHKGFLLPIKQVLHFNQTGYPFPIKMFVCLQNVRLPIVGRQNVVATMSLRFYLTGLGCKKEQFRYYLDYTISQNYISFYSNKCFFLI